MFLRRRRAEPAAVEPSLRWRLKHANPRGLSKPTYMAAERDAHAAMAAASVPPDDLADVRARLAADHRRGQRIRDARYATFTRNDMAAAFEREMAREANRGWRG